MLGVLLLFSVIASTEELVSGVWLLT